MTQPLHTWKLTPTSTPSALWHLSTLRSPIHVRAAGPLEARELAAQRFCQWTRTPSGKDRAGSPWLDPDLVYCTEDQDERLAALGEPCSVPD